MNDFRLFLRGFNKEMKQNNWNVNSVDYWKKTDWATQKNTQNKQKKSYLFKRDDGIRAVETIEVTKQKCLSKFLSWEANIVGLSDAVNYRRFEQTQKPVHFTCEFKSHVKINTHKSTYYIICRRFCWEPYTHSLIYIQFVHSMPHIQSWRLEQ